MALIIKHKGLREIWEEELDPMPVLKLHKENINSKQEALLDIGIFQGFASEFDEYNYVILESVALDDADILGEESTAIPDNNTGESSGENSGENSGEEETPGTPEESGEEEETEEETQTVEEEAELNDIIFIDKKDSLEDMYEIQFSAAYFAVYPNTEKDDFKTCSALFAEGNTYDKIPIKKIGLELHADKSKEANEGDITGLEEQGEQTTAVIYEGFETEIPFGYGTSESGEDIQYCYLSYDPTAKIKKDYNPFLLSIYMHNIPVGYTVNTFQEKLQKTEFLGTKLIFDFSDNAVFTKSGTTVCCNSLVEIEGEEISQWEKEVYRNWLS